MTIRCAFRASLVIPSASPRLRVILAWVLIAASLHAADATPPADQPLPQSDLDLIDKAITTGLAKPLKNYDAYTQSLDEAAAKLSKDFARIKADAMKRNDLPFAVAIDQQQKTISGPWLNTLVVARVGYGTEYDLLGQPIVKILIKADKTSKTSPTAQYGGTYPDLLYGFGDGGGGFIELSAQLPKGNFYLYALMTAGETRPCNLTVNGAMAGKGFAIVTGSWFKEGVQADRIGPFPAGGLTTLHIEPVSGPAPHFYGFMIASSPDLKLSVADFGK